MEYRFARIDPLHSGRAHLTASRRLSPYSFNAWVRLLVLTCLPEVAALDHGKRQRADVLLEGCVHLVHGDAATAASRPASWYMVRPSARVRPGYR